jgi:GNAT superfamily N-acetyltransferase
MEQRARIEPLTEADIVALVALACEIWHAHYSSIISAAQIKYMLEQRYSPAVVRAELQRDGWWWDKLVVGEEMAGFASYFLVDQSADRMKLDKLYVHPRHQRHGYGGMMIARACAVGRGRGCSRLELAVNKNNHGAIAAYLKHGFSVAAGVVKDIGGGFVMDDYIMVKPVTGDGSASRGGAGARLRDANPGGAQSGRQDGGDIHGNAAEAADE